MTRWRVAPARTCWRVVRGTDRANYTGSGEGVTVSLKTGLGTGGYAQGDTLSGIEDLRGSNNGDVLIGDDGANLLIGERGDDVLEGGAGADVLDGVWGRDTVSLCEFAGGGNREPGSGHGIGRSR